MDALEVNQLIAELEKVQSDLNAIRHKLELLKPQQKVQHFSDLLGKYPALDVITDEDIAAAKYSIPTKLLAELSE